MEFKGDLQFNSIQQASREKGQERLQAQVEIFADDKDWKIQTKDQEKMLRYAAELSKIKDLNNLPTRLPEELVELIQKYKDIYINFLRQEGKIDTSFVEENIKTYNEKFRPAIAELHAKIKEYRKLFKERREMPEHLGFGSMGIVYRIKVDNEEYAVKDLNNDKPLWANLEIKALLRAKNISNASQLVSYSFKDNVIIMELLPGKDMRNLTLEEAPSFTDEEIIKLIDNVIELDANGIAIDPNPSNFMYDTAKGFSILDYHLKNSGFTPDELSKDIIELVYALVAERKLEEIDCKSPDYDEKKEVQNIDRYKMYFPLLIRFLSILNDKYPDILAEWKRRYGGTKKVYTDFVKIFPVKDMFQDPEIKTHLEKLEEMGF